MSLNHSHPGVRIEILKLMDGSGRHKFRITPARECVLKFIYFCKNISFLQIYHNITAGKGRDETTSLEPADSIIFIDTDRDRCGKPGGLLSCLEYILCR